MTNEELGDVQQPENVEEGGQVSTPDADVLAQLEESQKKIKELEAQKEHWRTKANKAQEQTPASEPTPKPQESSNISEDEWKKRMEFIVTKGKGLDAEETDEVISYAKGKGISYQEALESPVMKSYLSERSSQKRVDSATPQSSRSSFKANGKTWESMSHKERAANFQQYLEQKKLGK